MAKARREVEENLKKIDVIIEILDARIPYSSHNPMMDEITQHKPRIVVLNKMDMADEGETDRWISHFKAQGKYPVAINGRSHQIISDRKSTRLNSSHVAISYAVFCLK